MYVQPSVILTFYGFIDFHLPVKIDETRMMGGAYAEV
jgi:hypothetical protein